VVGVIGDWLSKIRGSDARRSQLEGAKGGSKHLSPTNRKVRLGSSTKRNSSCRMYTEYLLKDNDESTHDLYKPDDDRKKD
jgi:hypothetical protein